MNGVLFILTTMGVLTLLLAALLIINMMWAVISRQIPQIGVLKSLGARPGQPSPRAAASNAIGLLVANAAHAPVGPFLGLNGPAIQRALRVNCDAPVRLARTYLPLMVERRRGGFVVVSSAAGLQGSPDLVLYAATKAFGRILAEGLWSELRQARVDVIACIAGAVRTPGWEASGMRTAPGILSSWTVAAQTYDRLGRGPIFVPDRITWTATTAMRLLPRRAAVALIDRANRRADRP
jgi:uncharacterized protein